MSKTRNKNRSFSSIIEIIKKMFNDNNSVLGECALSNNQKLFYLSTVAIPIRVIVLLSFKASYET